MIGGVYLAYPVDQRGPANLVYLFDQIEKIKNTLVNGGLCAWVFDPGDAFRVNPYPRQMDDTLPRINRVALGQADLVVAFLPAGVPSVGVPIEIDRARAMGKHVIVFSEARAWMLEMPGVHRFNDYEDESLEAALIQIAGMEPPLTQLAHDEMRVKVEIEGCMPTRTYPDDAGLDLIVAEDVTVPQGAFRDVSCGISVELPDYTWALVTGRSSSFRKRGLLVLPGVIDTGYRGPIFAGVFAQQRDVEIMKGERVAQMIIQANTTRRIVPVSVPELNPSARGDRGFGSTGA